MIVFIHIGNQSYFKASLAQARSSNPCSLIYLIGNSFSSPSRLFLTKYKINFISIDKFRSAREEFCNYYAHQGLNPVHYELFCFQRWFILRDFLLSFKGPVQGVMLDSDALLHTDIKNILSMMTTNMSVCDKSGPQFTFFKNVDVILDYTDFIINCYKLNSYKKKCEEYIKLNIHRGIPHMSDMVTLGLYAKSQKLFDTAKLSNSIVFDDNIAYSEIFFKGIFGKKIFKNNGEIFFKIIKSKKLIKVGGIHLQGESKRLWPIYVHKNLLIDLLDFKSVLAFIFMYFNVIRLYFNKNG